MLIVCVPPPIDTAVFMLALYVRYASLPSTYRIIAEIGLLPLGVPVAVTCTGLPTVAPFEGELKKTPAPPPLLGAVLVGVEVLAVPTEKFTVWEYTPPQLSHARTTAVWLPPPRLM